LANGATTEIMANRDLLIAGGLAATDSESGL
jgi:hypothetical protein